jgi:hypothetical protein
MISKEKLLSTLKDMPDRFSIDELIERVIVLQKIDVGLEQSKNSQTLTTEQAKERLGKWLK